MIQPSRRNAAAGARRRVAGRLDTLADNGVPSYRSDPLSIRSTHYGRSGFGVEGPDSRAARLAPGPTSGSTPHLHSWLAPQAHLLRLNSSPPGWLAPEGTLGGRSHQCRGTGGGGAISVAAPGGRSHQCRDCSRGQPRPRTPRPVGAARATAPLRWVAATKSARHGARRHAPPRHPP